MLEIDSDESLSRPFERAISGSDYPIRCSIDQRKAGNRMPRPVIRLF